MTLKSFYMSDLFELKLFNLFCLLFKLDIFNGLGSLICYFRPVFLDTLKIQIKCKTTEITF